MQDKIAVAVVRVLVEIQFTTDLSAQFHLDQVALEWNKRELKSVTSFGRN